MDKQMHEMTLSELQDGYKRAKHIKRKSETDKRRIRAFETWIARRKNEEAKKRKAS